MRVTSLITVGAFTGLMILAPLAATGADPGAPAPADSHTEVRPTVAQWGMSNQGQFGDSRGVYASWPVLMDWDIDVAEVVDGHGKALSILATDGTVWVAGDNEYGELGYNILPVDGHISWDLLPLEGIDDAVAVYESSQSGFILRENGELWSWGREHYGIRGPVWYDYTPRLMPGLPDDLVDVSPGSFHVLALDEDGQVWSWGRNGDGQAGHDGGEVPAVVTFPEVNDQPVVIERVFGAHLASYAIDTEGRLWAWGDNNSGQLGLGDNGDRSSPQHVTAVGTVVDLIATSATVWAVDSNGDLWTWGDGGTGELLTGSTSNVNTPGNRGPAPAFIDAAQGEAVTAVVLADGTIQTVGRNMYAELGDGQSGNYIDDHVIAHLPPVVDIAAGRWTFFATTATGEVYAWGKADSGELGRGNELTPLLEPVPTQPGGLDPQDVIDVAIGQDTHYFASSSGQVYASGDNFYDQVGDGQSGSYTDQYWAVPVVGVADATQVEGAQYNGFALDGGGVKAWGRNNVGQLGGPYSSYSDTAVTVTNASGPLTGIVEIAAGAQFALALDDDGDVWAWGSNTQGQWGGVGSTTDNQAVHITQVDAVSIGAGETTGYAVTAAGSVWAWGGNSHGQADPSSADPTVLPTLVEGLSDMVGVTGTASTGLAWDDEGTLFTWGGSHDGVLGLGDSVTASAPTPITGLGPVAHVAAGPDSVLVITQAGEVYTWGAPGNSALGVGDQDGRSEPTLVGTVTEASHGDIGPDSAIVLGSMAQDSETPTPSRQLTVSVNPVGSGFLPSGDLALVPTSGTSQILGTSAGANTWTFADVPGGEYHVQYVGEPQQWAPGVMLRANATAITVPASGDATRQVTLSSNPWLFSDVSYSHPFSTEILWMVEAGITTGYGDGTFRPGAGVSRQAMAAFLYRFAEADFDAPVTATFPDVPTSHPFFAEIEWMVDAGITTGYSDGTFRPGAGVSRQAMAAFLYRFAEADFDAPATATFPDVPTSHPFFAEIEWMVDAGITTGYGDGTFRPGNGVSRQAMAAFLQRMSI